MCAYVCVCEGTCGWVCGSHDYYSYMCITAVTIGDGGGDSKSSKHQVNCWNNFVRYTLILYSGNFKHISERCVKGIAALVLPMPGDTLYKSTNKIFDLCLSMVVKCGTHTYLYLI